MEVHPYNIFLFWCGRSKVLSLIPKIYLQKEALWQQKQTVMPQLFHAFHLERFTKSQHSCQNQGRIYRNIRGLDGKKVWLGKERALLLLILCVNKKKSSMCKGSLVHNYCEKEDNVRFPTSAAPFSLRWSLAARDIFASSSSLPLCDYRNYMWKWINIPVYA